MQLKAVQLRTKQAMSSAAARWVPEQLRNERYRLFWQIGFEIVLVVVFLKAYNLVRNQFGSQKCSPEYARDHALDVIWLERLLGIFWEQEIQETFLPFVGWIKAWNIFYGTAHMAVTVFVLIFLFILKPQAYQRCRTVFLVMNSLALIGYASYPLMPPRLVNDCDDPYGGCVKDYRFVDTMEEIGGLWSWKQKGIAKVTNHYAAMPSMHAGYSIWCSLSMYGHSPIAAFRVLAAIYPVMTIYCIVITANHYFMDAVFGALALWVAARVAPLLPQLGRGAGSEDQPLVNLSKLAAAAGIAEDEKAPLLPVSQPPGSPTLGSGKAASLGLEATGLQAAHMHASGAQQAQQAVGISMASLKAR